MLIFSNEKLCLDYLIENEYSVNENSVLKFKEKFELMSGMKIIYIKIIYIKIINVKNDKYQKRIHFFTGNTLNTQRLYYLDACG